VDVNVKVKKLLAEAILPSYQSSGASGCDITACLSAPLILAPNERAAVPTGLTVEIPSGFELQVRPRSGLAAKFGVTVINTPGTIDSDYRGEIKILLWNAGKEPFEIKSGDRVAQLVLQEVPRAIWVESERLGETERAEKGFGSTGFRAELGTH